MEEAVWFESAGERCFGILHRAEQERGLIVLLHGFTGNHTGNQYSFVRLARTLVEEGFSVFRFDYRGSGNSQGEFADQRISTCKEDLIAAVDHLTEQGVSTDFLGVLGHSMGGTVALVSATDIKPDVLVTWATIAAYKDLWSDTYNDMLHKQEEIVFYGFRFPTEKLTELLDYNLESCAAKFTGPSLFIHGEKDESVPDEHSRRLYAAASEPKKCVIREDSDHVFTHPDERDAVIKETVDWFDTHC